MSLSEAQKWSLKIIPQHKHLQIILGTKFVLYSVF